jgi:hypothetical protein
MKRIGTILAVAMSAQTEQENIILSRFREGFIINLITTVLSATIPQPKSLKHF